ncbi:hypothetical protein Bca4012_058246 [Brassica carinata]
MFCDFCLFYISIDGSDYVLSPPDTSLLPKWKAFQAVIFLERPNSPEISWGVCVEPKVILTTSINPKFVRGCPFLNATSGAYYLDNETLASETFLAGYVAQT